jgi:hypothetical protein
MSEDFMQGYGVKEERRGRLVKRSLIGGLTAIVLLVGGFFYFRTFRQERVLDRFMETLEQKNYDAAYQMWCSAVKPCPYYPKSRFEEDWGPSTPYSNPANAKIQNIDFCENGVLFNIAYPNVKPVVLWVESGDSMISFAPPDWQRCPGKHLQIEPFLHKIFGKA